MKRITLLTIAIFAFFAVNAQAPENWTGDTDIEISQETGNVHSGSASCEVIVNSDVQGSCDLDNDVAITVTAGESFKMAFWGSTSEFVRIRAKVVWSDGTTYANTYLGANSGGWVEFSFEDVVPDGVTTANVGLRFYDVSGFTPGQVQYVDDITFESPVGTAHTVANGDFEAGASVNPEPSNYPSDFVAVANGTDISLSWMDASGDVLPQGYLVLASDQDNISLPVDGTPVANDNDFSDGMGALNVSAGVQMASFAGLTASTNYYFKVFSYTNSGALIDYKTDGTAPSAEATTGEAVEDILFTTFNESWENWTQVSVVGDQEWVRTDMFGIEDSPCAKMTGYNEGAFDNEDWLISPVLDLTASNDEVLEFYSAVGYTGDPLQLMVSSDYDGAGNPNDFTWDNLTDQASWPSGDPFWEWTVSGNIDLSAFTNQSIYIAFAFTSTTEGSATWEIDNVKVMGDGEIIVEPEPTNYPADFAALATAQAINLSWMDATGAVVPQGYLVLASDQDNISLPVDGTPIANDSDLTDGMGALNVLAGAQMTTFAGLSPEMTYYFKIFPYTNTGNDIDYKTDATPPSAEATTAAAGDDILFTTFNESWENWTQVSVVGDQVWDRDNTYGLEDSPCAKMSGYDSGLGQSFDNEDWLISPAVDLTASNDEVLEFYSALAYTGDALRLMVSSDYDGAGNPNDFTWDNLSDQATWSSGDPFFEWTVSGNIDLSAFTDQSIYIAFAFTSTTEGSATWEIDNVKVMGDGEIIVEPEPTNYPSDYTAWAMAQTVFMSWTDATGDVLPEGYVVMISDQTELTLPVDGTPVANDLDLSDGNGAFNVMPGQGEYAFAQLMANATYYTLIIPFTNSGILIDYKTDGVPPSASATTDEVTTSDVLFTTFNESWENWTPVSVVGDQVWDRDNTYGIDDTPCAKMSGYNEGAFENEDWLISPAVDLTTSNDEMLEFYSAVGYTGDALRVLVSSDYDGAGNPNDFTWDNLSDQALWPAGDPFFEWTLSGDIDLAAYTEQTIYIAFAFTSTTEGSATWEIDNVRVKGETSGIGDYVEALTISLYPNPSTGLIYFSAEEPVSSIEVFNLIGMTVYQSGFDQSHGQIDLTNMEKGIYMIRLISNDEKSTTQRVVIQ